MVQILPRAAIALLAISLHISSGPASLPAQRAAANNDLTIPAGQKFILRLETGLHTNSTRKGDRVEFRTAAGILVANRVVVPSQSDVRATVTKAKRAGRLMGRAEIQLRLDEVRLADGTVFPLRARIIRVGVDPVKSPGSGDPSLKGDSGSGGSVGTVLQGGAQGAIIGVLSGSVKGAAYGGAIGAGIGLAGVLFRRGPDLDLPRDTLFEARFDQKLDVPAAVVQNNQQAAQRQAANREPEPPPDASRDPENAPEPARPVLRRRETTGTKAVEQEDRAPAPAQPVPAEAAPLPPSPAAGDARRPVETTTETGRPIIIPPVPAMIEPTPESKEPPAVDPAGYKLSVNVRMVQVDAVVKDRAGRMYEDLAREDFRIFEDGIEQTISGFSRDRLPLAVALVIDRSGSVAPYIAELRRVASHALQQLKPGDEVALFSFANTVDRVEDLTTDRQRIAAALDRVRAGGGTNIIDALFNAVSYLAKAAPQRRRAVILVSDNQATVRPRASESEAIRLAMESETVVYSLKTSGEGLPLTMRLPNALINAGSVSKITHESGGEVLDVRGIDRLDAALRSIVSRLRLRYALGYYPPPQGLGAFHTIEVRLADRRGKPGADYFIHARRGYYSIDARNGDQTKHM